MTTLQNLTVAQLHRALAIKEKIESLENELASLGGTAASVKPVARSGGMSDAVRAKISAAAKARWARVKGKGAASAPAQATGQKRKGMSAAVKAKLRAIAK